MSVVAGISTTRKKKSDKKLKIKEILKKEVILMDLAKRVHNCFIEMKTNE
jgi:hypothetical protein